MENRQFVETVFLSLLGRRGNVDEINYGVNQLAFGAGPIAYVAELAESHEAKELRKGLDNAPLFVPPGHYYSPVVDAHSEVIKKHMADAKSRPLLDVTIDEQLLLAWFEELSGYLFNIPFPEEKSLGFRYYFNNDFFGYGDALILSAMVQKLQPRQIVEIGSGFSSAVMLDTIDHAEFERRPVCTFIEPFTDRLRTILKDTDHNHVSILESPIQDVPTELFGKLEANDIVFFDTTHICRTGSDVNHDIFEVLPRLKPGVVIHFHDIFDGFEYPEHWVIGDNRSWNEMYTLRAFLMNNARYEVIVFNDYFCNRYQNLVSGTCPTILKNPGAGLWLRKLA